MSIFKKASLGPNIPVLVALLVLVPALVYMGSLRNGFIWDDDLVIVHNDFVKSWENLPAVFTKAYLSPFNPTDGAAYPGSGETTYRPVVTLSYFLDYAIWKLNPLGYHLTNLAWHVLNVLLLFVFAGLLLKKRWSAFWIALLFAVHPVNSETVNVISFREDLLVFFFYVAALIFFILKDRAPDKRQRVFSLASAGCFFFALFSKEMAITLPVMLIAYDYFFTFGQKWKELVSQARSRYGIYFLTGLCCVGVWFYLRQGGLTGAYPYPGGSLYTNFLTMAKVFAVYLQWILFPFHVHPTLTSSFLPITAHSILEPKVLFSIGLICAYVLAVLMLRKKKKGISFSLLWFSVALLPVTNIIPIASIMASRYLYLPLAGLSMAIVLFFVEISELRVPSITDTFWKRLVLDFSIIVLAIFGTITALMNPLWKSNISLWTKISGEYPRDPDSHLNLAYFWGELGQLDQAIREYEMAIQLYPVYPVAYNKYGATLGGFGRYHEAIKLFKEAIRLDPQYACAYNNLGATYANLKNWNEAEKTWRRVLVMDPQNGDAQRNLKKLEELFALPRK
ncbi:MAG: tetratricopeptide repeat protein [Candidatus Omnitrophota bacterium]